MSFRFGLLIVLLTLPAYMASDAGPLSLANSEVSQNGSVTTIHEIRGNGQRQNPVRSELAESFNGDSIFVRFRLEYDAEGLDTSESGDGEFFVLWLDSSQGGEASTHSGGIPNLGVHVDGETNSFMARFSPNSEKFGPSLVGDRETVLVGRLSKSKTGTDQPFDRLDLWVDPEAEDLEEPDASTVAESSRLREIRWLGFSTGGKTEPEDRIRVSDLALATDWETILTAPSMSISPNPKVEPLSDSEIPSPPAFQADPPKELVDVDSPPNSVETDHWSFQPMGRPMIPEVDNSSWVRSPVDAFIARRHSELGLSPAPVADDATLARRMSLVLTGLPPEAENAPHDFDEYAETLLASPAYGERWGRHWLDVARWAESNGHQHNRDRDHAWRYRDWVVDAFNKDKPYDQFVREQIAGDEISPYSPENVVATGFLAAARYSGNELDKDIQRNDILVDIVNTTSKAFLGLTMECAQCHDHFFDPITQWDYYRMQAFFVKGQPGDVILEPSPEAEALVAKRWGLFESVRNRTIEERRKQGVPEPVLIIPKSVPKGMTEAERLTFEQIEAELSNLPKTWGYYSPVTSPHELSVAPNAMRWPLPIQREYLEQVEVHFLDRGEPSTPGPKASPGWPQVFGSVAEEISDRPRLAFADWLTDPENPLTARVWVNRIWQGHFGRGLVETSGDFGVAGAEPSHPELLDWLARELIDSGWSTKHIHRLIVKSNTFRQSALFSASNAERDAGNAALWRWNPRRLEAEAIRDSALAVAGILDREVGGPSVPREMEDSTHRRSLYLQQRRDNLPHQQMLFDGAGAVTSCAKRRVSTTGLQPLWMLNSEFMQSVSLTLAERVAEDPTQQAARLVEAAYQRPGEKEEVAQLAALIEETSLTDAVAVILNTNEFVYIP